MPDLDLDTTSGTPVYRQIVEQIRSLVEDGGLPAGERLPTVRRLADSLGVNRNTVSRAYATLRELGVVETRAGGGTAVTAPAPRPAHAPDPPGTLVDGVRDAVRSGLSPDQVRDLAFVLAQRVATEVSTVFVECNHERAQAFAKELGDRLHTEVRPSLIDELDTATADGDLVVTTFFHLAEVRRWAQHARRDVETVAVVVAPHVRTLARVADLPAGARVGVRYSTPHQAEQVRDWFRTAGLADVVVVPHDGDVPADLAVLVVPSEDPGLAAGAAPGTEVVEFGNVLDEGSIRMVGEVRDRILEARTS
ncbi:GntR family transcriptional regulator [Actinomycetospora straminea]|uniref:HTH gntR-type domain-containing protein n=1 Tax=Actinomycetospora straminea TaxID=663607 RepID=A0ABP9FB30_9PSEU|nr:GntR family transcriptional regulator [Actinomycetospora straminea]MDD7936637.1 GntR family transcriptional regulator [Actinomycetospora straminea]